MYGISHNAAKDMRGMILLTDVMVSCCMLEICVVHVQYVW